MGGSQKSFRTGSQPEKENPFIFQFSIPNFQIPNLQIASFKFQILILSFQLEFEVEVLNLMF